MEGGHASAGDLGPTGAVTSPVGDRPDGVTPLTRAGDAPAPRCRDWLLSGGRLLDSDGRTRVLPSRQLHLRLRAARGGSPAPHQTGDRGRGSGDLEADAARRVPPPHGTDRRPRPATRL